MLPPSVFFIFFIFSSGFAAQEYHNANDPTYERFTDGGYERCDSCQQFTENITGRFRHIIDTPNRVEKEVACFNHSHGVQQQATGIYGPISKYFGPLHYHPENPNEVSEQCILKAMHRRKDNYQGAPNKYRVCKPSLLQAEDGERRKFVSDPMPAPGCWEQPAYVRRICISPDMVQLTQKSLNQVSACVGVSAKDVFPLLMHESSFIINKRSPTGATCYGQLTGDNIHRTNMNNHGRQLGGFNHLEKAGLSYDKLLERETCPQEVRDNFQPLATVEHSNYGYILSPETSYCEVFENPYSCLMYSLIAYKRNLTLANQELELAKVGVMPRQDGDGHFIFRSPEEAADFRSRHPFNGDTEYAGVDITQREIFQNPRAISHLLATWAYNGGDVVIRANFDDFLTELKIKLANPANKNLRETLIKNGGLSTTAFKMKFKEYLNDNYRGSTPVNEVTHFVSKIIGDINDHRKDFNGKYDCLSEDSPYKGVFDL